MATERVERPRGSLVNKLRWPIVISVAIALLIVGSVPIYIGGQAQRREILRVQQGRAEGIALSLSLYLQGAKNGLASFAQAQVALDRAERQVAFEQLLARGQSVYDEITLLDQEGNEVAKVSRFHTFLPAELGSQADTAAFQRARKGMDHIVKEPVISPYSGLPTVEMAVPVRDPASGDVTGVLMARVSIKQMWDEVAAVEVGERGYAYVINRTGRLLIHTDLSRYLQSQGEEIGRVPVVEKIIQAGVVEAEAEEYTGLDGERVVGAYAPIEGTPWITIVELPAEEAYASIQRMTISLIGLLMVAVLAIAGLTSWLPQRIIRPLAQLEEGAALLSSGRLGHRIALRTGDELEALGEAFNQMASRLQELYAGLEQQVADRTRELERRAVQLETAADVAREATAIRDVNQLLDETVRLISERFGFYHAGVFLVDDAREYAILRAASSEGGQRMLARGHKLAVGKVGMVGYVTGTGEPRIALDVGEDAVHFVNPDLPETRSEMTLPLRVRGEILGALDVQSTEEAAFSDEDVATLGTMADQLAVAIENARLFRETQDRLRELSRLYGEYSTAAWTQLAPAERPLGYVYDRIDVAPLGQLPAPALDLVLQRGEPVALVEPAATESTLTMPLKLRDQVIGALGIQETDEAREWSPDEMALVEAVSEQVALALESARLFGETQRRAETMRQLYNLSSALMGIESTQQAMTLIANATRQLIDAAVTTIYVYDEEKGEYGHAIAMADPVRWDGETFIAPRPDGLTAHIIHEGIAVSIADTADDERANPGLATVGLRSMLGAPIQMVGQKPIGVLFCNGERVGQFSDEDLRLITLLANRASACLQRIHLAEEVRTALEETTILYRASRAIVVAQTPDDVLRAFTDHVVVPQTDRCVLALIDPTSPADDPVVEIEAAWEPGVERPAVLGNRWSVSQIPLIARMTTEPLTISNVATSSEIDEISRHAFLNVLDIKAVAIIPLLAGERHLGWLLVELLKGPYDFSEREVRLYRALSGQAAVTLESMRLFKQAQRRAHRERLAREIAGKIQAAADVEAVLQTAVRELGRALGTPRSFVHLGTPGQSNAPPSRAPSAQKSPDVEQ